jgi:hypothetical protein
MTLNIPATAAALSDDALLARVLVLAGRERQATCELIAHLAELDTRKVLVAEGYSLFTYCTNRLGLSEDAAYTRVEVARAARRFPVILERLQDGSWSVTAIRMLGRHLTADNYVHVLEKARRRSKREVELLVAQIAPRPDVPSSVRKLPLRAPVPQGDTPNGEPPSRNDSALVPPAATTEVPAPGPRASAPAASRPPAVAPLSPERYRVQLTVGRNTHDTLRRLQDLLRREIPNGDPALIVERALGRTPVRSTHPGQPWPALPPSQRLRGGAGLRARVVPLS